MKDLRYVLITLLQAKVILGCASAVAIAVTLFVFPRDDNSSQTTTDKEDRRDFEQAQPVPVSNPSEEVLSLLEGPTLEDWPMVSLLPKNKDKLADYRLTAVAVTNHSPIFELKNGKVELIGRIRHGRRIRAKSAIQHAGCSKGQWHEIMGGGFVCTTAGFNVGKRIPKAERGLVSPRKRFVEPFIYGKVQSGSPRFVRIPTPEEEQAIASLDDEKAKQLDYLQALLNGIYFIGIVEEIQVKNRYFYRTSYNNFVRTNKVTLLDQTGMHGELLSSTTDLPLAFVFGDKRVAFLFHERELRPLGPIAKHARFRVLGSFQHQGQEYVIGPHNLALPREFVRIATSHPIPDGIPPRSKWIHLNLSQQTFVAYEGNKPVLASLISSGIEGRDTPTGLYRFDRKYVTKTMSGVDEEEGWYEVGEVPWTFFYRGNYAIHGAYWHNVFGETRSHGCTNIPPADARWLFGWLEPKMRQGWHAQFGLEKGWAYFTETKVDLVAYENSALLN